MEYQNGHIHVPMISDQLVLAMNYDQQQQMDLQSLLDKRLRRPKIFYENFRSK